MKYLAIILLSFVLIFSSGVVYAETQNSGGPNTQNSGGPISVSVQIENPTNIGNISDLLKALLSLAVQVGVPILVIAIIYVGFLFVQAQGNETKLAEAKAAFFWTIIGAAIVLGAFVISSAIQNTIEQIAPPTSLVQTAFAASNTVEETTYGGGFPAIPNLGSSNGGDTFGDIVTKIVSGIFNPLIGFIIALALLYFLWGLSKFVLNSGDEDSVKEAKQMMLWGVIALFVMVSVWGLVGILSQTFFSGELPTTTTLPSFR